ncbi:CLC_0170 family protein [Paenibacillus tianjinensis]|uniref:Uncharacterized protein n=1 Tax=Paenibacillus tianjinensis TaxID=2810347 RepID=A0ABX7LFF9_9BACL|nr:CLC_0170 family protein [Paenibacillus tianjinensis]QSF46083.1 hypothetical protein JRJ22_05540 [Paenibacillus tianjinensis]
MIRLLAWSIMVLLFAALVLLAVDRNIYRSSGWTREQRFTSILGWTYTVAALLILSGLLIYL